MHFHGLNLALLSLLAGASAETHKVQVGKSGDVFSPDSIKAAKGDVIEFHFDSMHSVVAGDFKKPCNPLSDGGFYSGSLPDGDKSYFAVTINNTDPIFFYCSVSDHCQEGMVGVINQGSSDTLSSYKSAAAKASKNVSPKAEFGGTVADKSGSSSAKASTTETATSTSTESSAASTTSGNAAGQLTGPIAGVSCLALLIAAFLG
ncbi:hypothetical protein QQX98_007044 [Neonectria punicea]|uniref:Phytocyanin domain-containing protein n=1 Tax=Neonectria punicea TaxID=979145 RepID=A0ABR1GZ44_9HYPO